MRNSLLPRPPRRHVWDRRKGFPGPPAPTPPAMSVVGVTTVAGDAKSARWEFSLEALTPPNDLGAFAIDGMPGQSWSWDGPSAVVIDHGGTVSPGQPWSYTADPSGVTGPDGQPLEAGSGTVAE